MKKTIVIFLFLFQSSWIFSQSIKDSLTLELAHIIQQSRIPGMGVSIISEKGSLYTHGFGLRDKETNARYDSMTIQPIASISKTFIGMAVMQLVESGKVRLDLDINTILPFKIINPRFPEAKISLLHLVTHTSSIIETANVDQGSYVIVDRDAIKGSFPKGEYKHYKKYLKNEHMETHEYVQAYLSMEGDHFKSNIFGRYKPGTKYSYSNIGSCLAAYIVELVSGQTFVDYTQQHIFEPLGIKSAAWSRQEIHSSNIAEPYFQNGLHVPQYHLISYPSSGLHINSHDMGIYMTEIINGYFGKGSLLNRENYQILLSNQIKSESIRKKKGIFWDINVEDNIGHDGSEIGTACHVIFSPTLRKAFFVMVNCSLYDDEALEKDYVDVLITLSKYSKRL